MRIAIEDTPTSAIALTSAASASTLAIFSSGSRLAGTLSRCEHVSPGDWMDPGLHGRRAGIPGEIALDVLLEAEKVARTEDLVREEIRRGLSPDQVFDKYFHRELSGPKTIRGATWWRPERYAPWRYSMPSN